MTNWCGLNSQHPFSIHSIEEVEMKGTKLRSMCELRHNHWLHWLTYKNLISFYLRTWLLD